MIRFTVQISNQLNAWLEEQARLNHRSKNKQIEHLLELAKQQKSCAIDIRDERWLNEKTNASHRDDL